jgi:hypothetical protein
MQDPRVMNGAADLRGSRARWSINRFSIKNGNLPDGRANHETFLLYLTTNCRYWTNFRSTSTMLLLRRGNPSVSEWHRLKRDRKVHRDSAELALS